MSDVLRIARLDDADQLTTLFSRYGLGLRIIPPGETIPGSFWGDEEAGLIGDDLIVRPDTPVHSALHEGCHFICMDEQRRSRLHTNAGGDDLEEAAVCYLQILLADEIEEFGRERQMHDMDAWGYSFRLGSTRAWFEQDAQDARGWLLAHGLIDATGSVTGKLRGY